MTANELRIGNYVKIKDSIFEEGYETGYDVYATNEFQITGFSDGSSMKGCKVICFYEIPGKMFGGFIHSGVRDLDIDPIPLTEEWLLKFGFTYDEIFGWSFSDSKTYFIMSYHSSAIITLETSEESIISVPQNIRYVHQLQNLYFALTGKELELKEKK